MKRDTVMRKLKLIQFYEERVKQLKIRKRPSVRNFNYLNRTLSKHRNKSIKVRTNTSTNLHKLDKEHQLLSNLFDSQSREFGSTSNLTLFPSNKKTETLQPFLGHIAIEEKMEEVDKISSQGADSESCSGDSGDAEEDIEKD